jgi:hypothetical protein
VFFSYYLPRKVICSKAMVRAAGTTATKLARWLASKGLVDEVEATEAAQLARHYVRELLDTETQTDDFG